MGSRADIYAYRLRLRGAALFSVRRRKEISRERDGETYAEAPDKTTGSTGPRGGGPSSLPISRERKGEQLSESVQGLRLVAAITEATDGVEIFDNRTTPFRSQIMAAACDTEDVEWIAEALADLRRRKGSALGWRSAHGIVLRMLTEGPPPAAEAGQPAKWVRAGEAEYLRRRIAQAQAGIEYQLAHGLTEMQLDDDFAELESLKEELAACENPGSRRGVAQ